jgi:hypothetical protein
MHGHTSPTAKKQLITILEQEIASAEATLDDIRRKLDLLKQLRADYIAELASAEPVRGRSGSRQQAAIEETSALLRERHEPVPVLEILDHLQARGVTFGGRDPRNALSVLLSRSKLFKAHGRRGWTLADD